MSNNFIHYSTYTLVNLNFVSDIFLDNINKCINFNYNNNNNTIVWTINHDNDRLKVYTKILETFSYKIRI